MRIVEHPPRPGFHHPLGRKEILSFLESVGPTALYGLREIVLRRGSATEQFHFGHFEAPGRILLFDQPITPWRIPTKFSVASLKLLEQSGAIIDADRRMIDWPSNSLRRFFLQEVLLHEIGHHHLQHYSGKRPVALARVKDHEAFAALHAQRVRDHLDVAP